MGAQYRAAAPLCQKGPAEVIRASDQDASWAPPVGGRHVQLAGGLEVDPEHAVGIIYLIWPGNASVSLRRSWRVLLWRGTSGIPYLACCPCDLGPDKQIQMDGWMDYIE